MRIYFKVFHVTSLLLLLDRTDREWHLLQDRDCRRVAVHNVNVARGDKDVSTHRRGRRTRLSIHVIDEDSEKQ